jgi:hypothetical protein
MNIIKEIEQDIDILKSRVYIICALLLVVAILLVPEMPL